MVPVSCCGARCAPCRRCGCVAYRPLPLARVASSATGSASLAPRTLTCGSSPLTNEIINPIVNVSFTMGFIGAGGRTRTGTLSPAVDFESTTSTNSITPAGVLHDAVMVRFFLLRYPIKSSGFRLSSILSTAATRSGRFFRHWRRFLRSPSHRQVSY